MEQTTNTCPTCQGKKLCQVFVSAAWSGVAFMVTMVGKIVSVLRNRSARPVWGQGLLSPTSDSSFRSLAD
jgi:hypothetical protein